MKDKQIGISIERLKSGDRAEFAKLVEEYSELIFRLGLKMLGNEQDAEDILQETFLKAFRSMHTFQGNSSISTWLYRIATNESLMYIRKRRPEQQQVTADDDSDDDQAAPLQIVDWGKLPEEQLLSDESIAYLNQLVQTLSPPLRVVFILRDVLDQSVRETAEVLNISESAVKTRLSRARLQLRQDLSKYFQKDPVDKDIVYGKK